MPIEGRFRSFDFWDGAVFGIAATSIGGILIGWILSSSNPSAWSALATLCTIPAAMAAAWVAFGVTRYQLNHAREQDIASARAVLPLALTRMIDISNNAILIVANQHPMRPMPLETVKELLSIDGATIQALRDNIRAADPVTREWIGVAIARYQVNFARIEGWYFSPRAYTNADGQTVFDLQRMSALLDWAIFYALSSHLFRYARGGIATAPERMDTSVISTALDINLPSIYYAEEFTKMLSRRLSRISDGRIDHFRMTL